MKKHLFSIFALVATSLSYAQVPLIDGNTVITTSGIVQSPAGFGLSNLFDGDKNTVFSDEHLNDGCVINLDFGRPVLLETMTATLSGGDPALDPLAINVRGHNVPGDFGVNLGEVGSICGQARGAVVAGIPVTGGVSYRYYSVLFTVYGSCSYQNKFLCADFQMYEKALSVDDNHNASKVLRVYPTLVDDKCYIDNSQALVLETVEVSSVEGKVLKVIKGDVRDFDVSDLSSGAYIVKIKAVNGLESVQKVVKK